MTTVVLLAHSSDTIISQNIFCLFSLLHQVGATGSGDLQIFIYTDQPARFQKYFGDDSRIKYVELTPARVREWRGSIDFVHRVKVEMLRDAGTKLSGQVKTTIFYVDGDTIFLKDPAPLFAKIDAKNSVMHELENYLDEGRDPLSKKMARFLRKQWPAAYIKKQLSIDHANELNAHVAMWNSGVLGFTSDFFPRLDDVLQLTEELYTQYPKHVMEQLALSFYMQKCTHIHDAREYIFHYWRQKDAYNNWIAQFLSEHPNVEAAHRDFDLARLPSVDIAAAKPDKLKWFKKWRSLRA